MEFNNDVEVDAFHLENDERKMPAKATSCNSSRDSSNRKSSGKSSSRKIEPARKAIKSAHKKVYSRNDDTNDKAIAMLEEEKNRSSSRFNTNGKREGFGSFYDRPRWDNSFAERTAKIGHKDHVRTVDLTTEDPVKYRYEDSDYSLCSSDWKK